MFAWQAVGRKVANIVACGAVTSGRAPAAASTLGPCARCKCLQINGLARRVGRSMLSTGSSDLTRTDPQPGQGPLPSQGTRGLRSTFPPLVCPAPSGDAQVPIPPHQPHFIVAQGRSGTATGGL